MAIFLSSGMILTIQQYNNARCTLRDSNLIVNETANWDEPKWGPR